jgi:hypothetical protein
MLTRVRDRHLGKRSPPGAGRGAPHPPPSPGGVRGTAPANARPAREMEREQRLIDTLRAGPGVVALRLSRPYGSSTTRTVRSSNVAATRTK